MQPSPVYSIGWAPEWPPSAVWRIIALKVEDFDAAVAALHRHETPIIIDLRELPGLHMVTVRILMRIS